MSVSLPSCWKMGLQPERDYRGDLVGHHGDDQAVTDLSRLTPEVGWIETVEAMR